MKDTHNVILILDSPKWLILYFGGSSNSRFHLIHLFFSRSSKLFQVCHHEDLSKSLQCFTLCFQLLFLFVILLFTGVLHGGSTWWFIKDLIPSRSAHQDSFQRSSSILHLAFRSVILSTSSLRWCYVNLDNLSSCFMIHMLLRMRYFKSINLFFGVILGLFFT